MANLGYIRVSSKDQTVETQSHALEERYRIERWFRDDAISGTTKAADRPGLAKLIEYARDGDTVIVYAIDRLGRNTVDVLTTVSHLQEKGVAVVSLREGFDLSTPIGKAMLTMLAAVAELERENTRARQMAGIERARAAGQHLGRKQEIDYVEVAQWRTVNGATIRATADHFNISPASVKRACRTA